MASLTIPCTLKSPRWAWAAFLSCCIVCAGKNFVIVDMPLVMRDFQASNGMTYQEVSWILACGYAFSAFGKVAGGLSSDLLGSQATTVGTVLVSTLATLAFAALPRDAPLGCYGSLWGLIVLSALGVQGISRTTFADNWIPKAKAATLQGMISACSDLGDAMVRVMLLPTLSRGWRGLFQLAAVFNLLAGAPIAIFAELPDAAHADVLGETHAVEDKPKRNEGHQELSFTEQLRSLVCSPRLYALTVISGALYGTRALFINFFASYLAYVRCRDLALGDDCLTDTETLAAAAFASSTFTLAGSASPIVAGALKDALPARHRAMALLLFIGPSLVCMLFLTVTGHWLSFYPTLVMVSVAGVFLNGPLKIMKVFAMDVGGKGVRGMAVSFLGVANNIVAVSLILVKGAMGRDWTAMFGGLSFLMAAAFSFSLSLWLRDGAAHRERPRLEQDDIGQVPLLSSVTPL